MEKYTCSAAMKVSMKMQNTSCFPAQRRIKSRIISETTLKEVTPLLLLSSLSTPPGLFSIVPFLFPVNFL